MTTGSLPRLYFRLRDNGAAVFRVDTENRQRRLELDQIAAVNIRNGEIRPQGDTPLTEEDLTEIRGWLAERRAILARQEAEAVQRTLDAIGQTAHWAQTRAEDAALESVTDQLLLAMHDLRSVLVRKRAERLAASQATAAD